MTACRCDPEAPAASGINLAPWVVIKPFARARRMARGRVWSVSCWPQRRLRTIQWLDRRSASGPAGSQDRQGPRRCLEVLFHAGGRLGSLFVVAKGLRRLLKGTSVPSRVEINLGRGCGTRLDAD